MRSWDLSAQDLWRSTDGPGRCSSTPASAGRRLSSFRQRARRLPGHSTGVATGIVEKTVRVHGPSTHQSFEDAVAAAESIARIRPIAWWYW